MRHTEGQLWLASVERLQTEHGTKAVDALRERLASRLDISDAWSALDETRRAFEHPERHTEQEATR